MPAPETAARPPRLQLGAVVWAAAMTGVVAMAVYLPDMVRAFGDGPADLPAWLPLLVAAQNGVLVALLAAVGAGLAWRLGLHAPVAEALVSGRPVGPALRPQVAPGLVGGAFGAVLLTAAPSVAPEAITALAGQWDPPLWVRVLYGGVTEEVMVRWGVMTGLVWLGWRLVQRRDGAPTPAVLWAAVVGSSLLFGAGHLPAAAALVGSLSPSVVAYVVLANSAFGLVAGWLYWRRGLEAAVLAHVGAHVGAVALATLVV